MSKNTSSTPRHFAYKHPLFGAKSRPKNGSNSVYYYWWAFLKRMNAHGPVIDYMPPYIRARQKALKRDEIEMKRRIRSMVRRS